MVGERGCGVLVPGIVAYRRSSWRPHSLHSQPSRSITACLLTKVYVAPNFRHRLLNVDALPNFLLCLRRVVFLFSFFLALPHEPHMRLVLAISLPHDRQLATRLHRPHWFASDPALASNAAEHRWHATVTYRRHFLASLPQSRNQLAMRSDSDEPFLPLFIVHGSLRRRASKAQSLEQYFVCRE